MDYGAILSRAARITWRYKILWLFGFLASLTTQYTANIDYDDLPPQLQRWMSDWLASPWVIPVLLFFLALGIVFAVLAALGRAALVDQVNQVEDGVPATAQGGWQAAGRYGWRVFWISLVLGLPVLLIFAVAFLPLLAWILPVVLGPAGDPSGEIVPLLAGWFVCLCCIGVLLAIFLTLLRDLAERACVLEDLGIWDSLERGWMVLRAHTAQVLILWLILAVLGIALFMGVAIPIAIITALLMAAVTGLTWVSPWLTFVGYLAAVTLLWLVALVIGAVVSPFFSGCWTLAYRDWMRANQRMSE